MMVVPFPNTALPFDPSGLARWLDGISSTDPRAPERDEAKNISESMCTGCATRAKAVCRITELSRRVS